MDLFALRFFRRRHRYIPRCPPHSIRSNVLEEAKEEGIVVDLSTLYQDFFGPAPKRPKYILPYLKGHYWQQQIEGMLAQRRTTKVGCSHCSSCCACPVLLAILLARHALSLPDCWPCRRTRRLVQARIQQQQQQQWVATQAALEGKVRSFTLCLQPNSSNSCVHSMATSAIKLCARVHVQAFDQ